MFRNKTVQLILSILLLFFIIGCHNKPQSTGEESGEIDVSQEPEQAPYNSDEPIIKTVEDGEFKITPVAEYKISAVVVSKKSYSYGWNAEVAPVDLALVWGKLAEPEYDEYISYSQRDRWYFYEYKAGTPVSESYIIKHSSNNHIIPADENIYRAIKTLGRKDKIILEGLLVNLKGKYKGMDYWWNSSLSRKDTGDSSCELVYVRKVRIGNEVYE